MSVASICALTALGCATPPKPAAPKKPEPTTSASASAHSDPPLPPEPPLPVLTSSTAPAVEDPTVYELTLLARAEDGAFELLEYKLPYEYTVGWIYNEVTLADSVRPYAFFGEDPREIKQGQSVPPMRLWIRRPIAEKGRDLGGESFSYSPNLYNEPGKHLRFHAAASQPKPDPKLVAAWSQALALNLGQHYGAFYAFAADKLSQRTNQGKPAPRNTYGDTQAANDLSELFATTTGRSSVQRALEQNRALYLELSSGPRKIPIEKVVAPVLTRHPWASMIGLLKQKPTVEALAKATPADFYFLRVRDFAAFLDLAEVADSWGTPALDILDGQIQSRAVRERYQTELALEQGELARTFGPSVIEEMALVGSDPYLVEGSDLTLIFRVKSKLLFDGALLKSLATFTARHPGGESSKFTHEGVEVTVTRSADGQIRRHRASVDGFELVSNSPGGIKRVISAIHGKAPRLADEPDFLYMLARDADQNPNASILAFAGDRFIESVVGPQQKIKEAERALALAELSRPGYAALLYGFLNGHAPANAQDLVAEKLLSPADLRPNGVAAGWQPGSVPRNTRGSTLDAVPLIDSPDMKLVTNSERKGYESFASFYENDWSEYVDPFAVRVGRSAGVNGGTKIDAELRVLPLLRHEYRDYMNGVGDAHVDPGPLTNGARLLLGIGKDAEVRRLLDRATRELTGHDLSFDWLGDYAFVGVADRNELALAARYEHGISPEKPQGIRTKDDRRKDAALLPAYAGIAVRSTTATAIAIAIVKRVSEEDAPNTITWTEARTHRGVSIVCVQAKDPDVQDFKLYYALTDHALLFSLNPSVLEALIDQYAEGKAPAAIEQNPTGRDPQLVFDLKGKPQGGLYTVLAWLFTKAISTGSYHAADTANAVFHGAPEIASDVEKSAALMRNYFGSVPLTPEGKTYTFGPDGVRDPLRGNASSPAWPAIPAPGSPVANVIDRLDSLRSEVAFDSEPSAQPGNALQSLRVHLAITLR